VIGLLIAAVGWLAYSLLFPKKGSGLSGPYHGDARPVEAA